MLTLAPFTATHVAAVKRVRLAEEQVKFVGTAESFLEDQSETTHLHIIKMADEIIGYFKLDIEYWSTHPFCPKNGLGLRAFVIDCQRQGQGLGTLAATTLVPYAQARYPEFESIYLTVNCRNPAAITCYLKGGFEDTNEKYLDGPAGPQHIMKASLFRKHSSAI
ncbi:GNAT family protein [Pseudoalteromonas sp. S2755]|uniref:GNAT family N-acetyltransferase n=1 Tax=Pseudoalteromonas sp. S2755 TaxID=2066523 RepID=UPI00110B9E51|nr:GNAT family protein [Pseudoalteromonas sp. S2755]TMN32501.1 GNAT family N-acetyltransferase [Pseudoalteromonas sp. S2755]